MTHPLATIGYEAATLDEVIDKLRGAGIEILIDVRAVASSRRAGFSKTILSNSLLAVGIDYLHLRGLGTPKPGREAARAGRIAEMRDIYDAHLKTEDAVRDMATAEGIVASRHAALLCYEASASECHRRIIAERLTSKLALAVIDL